MAIGLLDFNTILLLSIDNILLAVLELPDKSPIKYLEFISRLESNLSWEALYNIDGPDSLWTSKPAPSAWDKLLELLAKTMVLSLTSTCVEFTIVCEPSICRLPLIIKVPVLPSGLGSI